MFVLILFILSDGMQHLIHKKIHFYGEKYQFFLSTHFPFDTMPKLPNNAMAAVYGSAAEY